MLYLHLGFISDKISSSVFDRSIRVVYGVINFL